jgi:two-component system chemotaxis response regulator CheB
VVLTGALDDGTAGLQAIKERGGVAVVQDPGEAYNPGMPSSAMKYVNVDYCLPLASIAPLLVELARDPFEMRLKADEVNMERLRAGIIPEAPSGLTCPECSASLSESQHERLLEFRCRVGHTFSPEGLLADQSDRLERVLWSSLNIIEERAALIGRLAAQARESDKASVASLLEAARQNVTRHSDQIRHMLLDDGDWYSLPTLSPGVSD